MIYPSQTLEYRRAYYRRVIAPDKKRQSRDYRIRRLQHSHPLVVWVDRDTMEELRVYRHTKKGYNEIVREALEWWLENRRQEEFDLERRSGQSSSALQTDKVRDDRRVRRHYSTLQRSTGV